MDYNYHTHTFRCKHATETEEEYVKRAIEGGIKYMGFSDHMPLKFEDGFESFYRVPVAEVEDYVKTVTKLREKYKSEIEIKVGFETEYYPEYFPEMLNNAALWGGEYLILGQHFLGPEHPSWIASTDETDNTDYLKRYVSLVLEAMETGVFTCVAHPDVFNFTGDTKTYNDEMRKICVKSRELDLPLEINLLGIRAKRFYPNEKFWKLAGEEQSPVTFGFDAHDAPAAYDGESIKTAKELIKKYNLNYIGCPRIIPIKK